jgi:6,7-dimethyl-8-ribityllumazine synthase
MSGNAPRITPARLEDARIAIISASWHRKICDDLVAGAKRALQEADVKQVEITHVAGSFGADAAIVLGVVIRGETPHFDYVCQGVTDGVMRVSLDLDKPIGFGVLTVENIEQAVARSGVAGSKEDKGYDSAIAALDLLRVKRELFDRFAK